MNTAAVTIAYLPNLLRFQDLRVRQLPPPDLRKDGPCRLFLHRRIRIAEEHDIREAQVLRRRLHSNSKLITEECQSHPQGGGVDAVVLERRVPSIIMAGHHQGYTRDLVLHLQVRDHLRASITIIRKRICTYTIIKPCPGIGEENIGTKAAPGDRPARVRQEVLPADSVLGHLPRPTPATMAIGTVTILALPHPHPPGVGDGFLHLCHPHDTAIEVRRRDITAPLLPMEEITDPGDLHL